MSNRYIYGTEYAPRQSVSEILKSRKFGSPVKKFKTKNDTNGQYADSFNDSSLSNKYILPVDIPQVRSNVKNILKTNQFGSKVKRPNELMELNIEEATAKNPNSIFCRRMAKRNKSSPKTSAEDRKIITKEESKSLSHNDTEFNELEFDDDFDFRLEKEKVSPVNYYKYTVDENVSSDDSDGFEFDDEFDLLPNNENNVEPMSSTAYFHSPKYESQDQDEIIRTNSELDNLEFDDEYDLAVKSNLTNEKTYNYKGFPFSQKKANKKLNKIVLYRIKLFLL